MKNDETKHKIYSFISEELYKRLSYACITKGIKNPAGIEQAIAIYSS